MGILNPDSRRAIALLIFASLALVTSAKVGCDGLAATSEGPVIDGLADEVEWIAARTRPPHWPLKRSCLYYALAGRALLAHYGIDARLRVGAVDYCPGTASHHAIEPHAWLQTDTYFIDYATLPRCGQATRLPRNRVATDPMDVRPGVTRVLVLADAPTRALMFYLRHHSDRFSHSFRMLLLAAEPSFGIPRLDSIRRWPKEPKRKQQLPGHEGRPKDWGIATDLGSLPQSPVHLHRTHAHVP